MRTGTVIGSVWATRRLDGIPPGAFLSIDLDGGAGRLVAFDVLGTGVGERVLIAEGLSAARRFPVTAAIDAVVVGSLDTAPPGDGPAGTGTPQEPAHAAPPAATASGDHQKGNSHV